MTEREKLLTKLEVLNDVYFVKDYERTYIEVALQIQKLFDQLDEVDGKHTKFTQHDNLQTNNSL